MKNYFVKGIVALLISAIFAIGFAFVVSADVSSTFWAKQSNGQLYTNSGNGLGNATINVAGCNGCGSGSYIVNHDNTLFGDGTVGNPLGVVGANISDAVLSSRVATTATLAGSPTYNNGTSGVGATLTRGSNGVLPAIDGVTLSVSDRILVKNQSTTLQNGVYEVTSLGSVSTPWVLTRTTDADETLELDELVVSPSEGTQRATLFGQQTSQPTIGTSPITFASTTSLFVTQATAGTQTNGNIPYWTSTARQLRRGDGLFNRNPTTQATRISQLEGNVIRGFKIDLGTADSAMVENKDFVTGYGAETTWEIDRMRSYLNKASTYSNIDIDLDNSVKKLSFDIGTTTENIVFAADLGGSPKQGQLEFTDIANNKNSRFNVRSDSAIMVHASQVTPSIISKRIVVDTNGVTIQNNGGSTPKFILKNGDTSTEYVSFDPATGIYKFKLTEYANNAAAVAAGLPVGALYYTTSGSDGIVKIVK